MKALDEKDIKVILLNGLLSCLYVIDIDIIFLKSFKTINHPVITSSYENYLVDVINFKENTKITKVSFLNI